MAIENNFKPKYFYHFLKRCFDIFASLIAIGILLLPFAIIAIIIRCNSKGSAFYLDDRLGKNKKPIKIIKFRTMRSDSRPIQEILSKDEYEEYLKNYKLDNDPRMTSFGKFLRKTSIDELPQIFNIFIGQMSFVGPRPIKKNEFDLHWKNHDEIFLVKPGLTGYWGVNGRSETTYEKRIELEIYYVYHRSILLDIKILFKTVAVVFSKKGAV